MGPVASTQRNINRQNIVNDILTNLLVDISSKCKTTSTNTQSTSNNTFTFSGIKNSTINVQAIQQIKATLTSTCLASNEIQNKLAQDFKAQLESETRQRMSGASAFSTSEVNTVNSLINEITSNINIKSLTECITKTVNDQQMFNNVVTFKNIDSSNISFSLSQYIIGELVHNCLLSNDTLNSAALQLENLFEQKTSQETKGFDLNEFFNTIASVFNNLIDTIGMVWFAIIVGFLAIILFAPKLLCIIPGSQFILGTFCKSNNSQNNSQKNY